MNQKTKRKYSCDLKLILLSTEDENFVFSTNYAWFNLGFQVLYIYLPFIIILIFNGIIFYTLYELNYISLLNSSEHRVEKIAQVKEYSKVINKNTNNSPQAKSFKIDRF